MYAERYSVHHGLPLGPEFPVKRDKLKKANGRTFNINRSRIPRSLHDAAQKYGYVCDFTLFESRVMLRLESVIKESLTSFVLNFEHAFIVVPGSRKAKKKTEIYAP